MTDGHAETIDNVFAQHLPDWDDMTNPERDQCRRYAEDLHAASGLPAWDCAYAIARTLDAYVIESTEENR